MYVINAFNTKTLKTRLHKYTSVTATLSTLFYIRSTAAPSGARLHYIGLTLHVTTLEN
jgi:hypothetical protein